jgi:tetratricopeptide (TPR) repeat protein
MTGVRRLAVVLLLVFAVPLAAALPTRPSSREWNALQAEYGELDASRKAAPQPSPAATRKEQIEIALQALKKLEPLYVAFQEKLLEYYERTGDRRAAELYAAEKIRLGDIYATVLSRYDKAISMYRNALAIDPTNEQAKQRLAVAESRRFAAIDAFASVRGGMKEAAVRALVGMPPEDWIKQVVQNKHAYSVWIYPKRDGGAAAIYFDGGVVYHTNWNAAPPPAASDDKQGNGEGVKQ